MPTISKEHVGSERQMCGGNAYAHIHLCIHAVDTIFVHARRGKLVGRDNKPRNGFSKKV